MLYGYDFLNFELDLFIFNFIEMKNGLEESKYSLIPEKKLRLHMYFFINVLN